ncbi:MAG: B12-binding domain-containing radical SAM protein [Candidatus Woesearchaeota archaeon]
MRNVLFVYLPFASPVSPPYSLTYLHQFVSQNMSCEDVSLSVLDLNAKLHRETFPEHYKHIREALHSNDLSLYETHISQTKKDIDSFTIQENNKLHKSSQTESIQFCLHRILDKKPDVVLLSVIYNSQVFFALTLSTLLEQEGIDVIVGGPAVSKQLKEKAVYLANEVELVEYLSEKPLDMDSVTISRALDFSIYDSDDYFTSEVSIPLRSSSTCYYQKCTFCTHHGGAEYVEYDIADIVASIRQSNAQSIFLVDDMIHTKRLLALADAFRPLNITWMCQLKPDPSFDKAILQALYESGLRVVIWGVESGNDRILELMNKGITVENSSSILQQSKEANIANVTYVMFGFPTETKKEFLDTIGFLQSNEKHIDLISTAVFGLQEHSPIMEHPEQFSIVDVQREQRTFLPDKITYSTSEGLSNEETKKLRTRHMNKLININTYPREMNIFREHMLLFVSRSSNTDDRERDS